MVAASLVYVWVFTLVLLSMIFMIVGIYLLFFSKRIDEKKTVDNSAEKKAQQLFQTKLDEGDTAIE